VTGDVIFDGHNDTLLRLLEGGGNFFERRAEGHVDLPRAREGGLGGGLCAMFVPSQHRPPPGSEEPPDTPSQSRALEHVQGMITLLREIEAQSDGQVEVVEDAGALRRALDEGRFAAVIHVEGAEAIDRDLESLQALYEAGLRSLGPVWSRPNTFAYGVPFLYPHSPDTGPGLTEAGQDLVRACNSLGIMIDLSHLNEKGFWDVARISTMPLVASHSNAHSLCPSTRNLTDRQLDSIAESGGIVGVNFATYFLEGEQARNGSTSLTAIVRHLQYLAERMGIEHVGLGSDFDGARIPDDLGDASGLPRLLDEMRRTGFDDSAVAKVTHENWLRVLRETWRPAEPSEPTSI
jgi:membrane dipeptidase